jgi:hypothetical protein
LLPPSRGLSVVLEQFDGYVLHSSEFTQCLSFGTFQKAFSWLVGIKNGFNEPLSQAAMIELSRPRIRPCVAHDEGTAPQYVGEGIRERAKQWLPQKQLSSARVSA